MPSLQGEPASNGEFFYHVHDPPPMLIEAYDLLLAAAATFRRAAGLYKDPAAKLDEEARAAVVDLVIKQVSDAAHVIATQASIAAVEASINILDTTQKRPDPIGKLARLRDGIVSKPIPGTLGTLEVGIGDMNALDSVAREYWRVQEIGSSHLVGHTVYGRFFGPGGYSYPSPDRAGEDSTFIPGRPSRRMIVRNPIEGKFYLDGGMVVAERLISREFQRVESLAISELDLVVKGTHPRMTAARRAVGRRVP